MPIPMKPIEPKMNDTNLNTFLGPHICTNTPENQEEADTVIP